MVSTRSHQTKLEDLTKDHDDESNAKKRPREKSDVKEDHPSIKKKSGDTAPSEPSSAQSSTTTTKTKTEKDVKEESKDDEATEDVKVLKKSDDTDRHSTPIKINRAPVLDLFASCSAHFQHPDLSWESCLSLGSAIASICAVSKGRSIGVIPESESESSKKQTKSDDESISVLGFHVPLRDGIAYVGNQKKPANESYLKYKFGERYDEVKSVMNDALSTWKGHEDEFAGKGFHMYEKFRPGNGQWGQAGGLDVEEVKRVITK